MTSRMLARLAFASFAVPAIAVIAGAPALAQMNVFDAATYGQGVLTAARTLTQINQQIRQLQNEAQMLANMGRNLSRIDFPQLRELRQRLEEIDRLMGEAQGVDFRVGQLDAQLRQLFPDDLDQRLGRDQRVLRARNQLEAAMATFRQTMGVQNRIVENVRGDAEVLQAIVARSQGAEGALQATQATNQLLALTAKQQLQIQTLMAAQFRAEAVEQARAGQVARAARASTRRFLGDGRAYTPRRD